MMMMMMMSFLELSTLFGVINLRKLGEDKLSLGTTTVLFVFSQIPRMVLLNNIPYNEQCHTSGCTMSVSFSKINI